MTSPFAAPSASSSCRGTKRSCSAAFEQTSSRPHDRALAANLLGLVAFDQARSQAVTNVAPLLRRSAAAFRRAIVLDPTADDAKANLEAILRLTRASVEFDRRPVGFFGTAEGPGTGSGRRGGGY